MSLFFFLPFENLFETFFICILVWAMYSLAFTGYGLTFKHHQVLCFFYFLDALWTLGRRPSVIPFKSGCTKLVPVIHHHSIYGQKCPPPPPPPFSPKIDMSSKWSFPCNTPSWDWLCIIGVFEVSWTKVRPYFRTPIWVGRVFLAQWMTKRLHLLLTKRHNRSAIHCAWNSNCFMETIQILLYILLYFWQLINSYLEQSLFIPN